MELPQVPAISYLPLTVSGQSRRIKGRNTLFFATAPIATHYPPCFRELGGRPKRIFVWFEYSDGGAKPRRQRLRLERLVGRRPTTHHASLHGSDRRATASNRTSPSRGTRPQSLSPRR